MGMVKADRDEWNISRKSETWTRIYFDEKNCQTSGKKNN